MGYFRVNKTGVETGIERVLNNYIKRRGKSTL